MKVKHLDDLYSMKQIRKLQCVFHANETTGGFIPVAFYAPKQARLSRHGGSSTEDGYYEWYGTRKAFYAKTLWEYARAELKSIEDDSLAYEIVSRNECFNTIRFRDGSKVLDYCRQFRSLLKRKCDENSIPSVIGPIPNPQCRWGGSLPYHVLVITDEATFTPGTIHRPIPAYQEFAPLPWNEVAHFFVDLDEDELAFLHGGNRINKESTSVDLELIDACAKINPDAISYALARGANANCFSGKGFPDTPLTTLIWSVQEIEEEKRNFDLIFKAFDLLFDAGADIDLSGYEAATPLFDAINAGPRLVSFLLERGANPNGVAYIGASWSGEMLTPFDHVSDDIAVFGEEPGALETRNLLDARGGKYFTELHPTFYEHIENEQKE